MVRIDKIYTKSGDDGSTNIISKHKVRKNDIIIEAIGTVDELNSYLGLARISLNKNNDFIKISSFIKKIQHVLFNIGTELVQIDNKHKFVIDQEDVEILETEIDRIRSFLRPLDSFVIPGTGIQNAHMHVARSLCRRAERIIVHLKSKYQLNQTTIKFINRLSDLLFVYARYISFKLGEDEEKWKK